MKKRIASIALSLAMCLTLLPTAAYAEDVSEGGAFDSQARVTVRLFMQTRIRLMIQTRITVYLYIVVAVVQ